MADIKSSHFCTRCSRATAHRLLGHRSDCIVQECVSCLRIFARKLSGRFYRFSRARQHAQA